MTGILPATRGRGVIGSMLGIPDILLFARTVSAPRPAAMCGMLLARAVNEILRKFS